MLYAAELICSDPDCAERVDAVGTLEELETLVCNCGCGLAVVGWPDPVEEERTAEVVAFVPRAEPQRRAA